MRNILKTVRIFIKYLRKFLCAITTIIAPVKINTNKYPFSKEFKALNQDFIAIGEDITLAINKQNKNHD